MRERSFVSRSGTASRSGGLERNRRLAQQVARGVDQAARAHLDLTAEIRHPRAGIGTGALPHRGEEQLERALGCAQRRRCERMARCRDQRDRKESAGVERGAGMLAPPRQPQRASARRSGTNSSLASVALPSRHTHGVPGVDDLVIGFRRRHSRKSTGIFRHRHRR
jgi:hypothetical protein